MKSRRLTFFLVALLIGGLCTACNGVHLAKPIHSAKLRPRVAYGWSDKRFSATGTAERLESGDWKLTLMFAGIGPDGVKEVKLLGDEPQPLSLHDADGKLFVAWEVPRKRWLDWEPFELSVGLQGRDSDVLVTVGHRATESEPTALGYVVGNAVQLALTIAVGSSL